MLLGRGKFLWFTRLFFTSDVTVILKTPSKERTAQRNTAALAGAGQLV